MSEQHFRKSAAREKIVEHVFAAKLLQYAWSQGVDLEVLRSEVDAAGYDLVLEAGGIVRHVQLKSLVHGGKRRSIDVHLGLASKPSGCVVCLDVAADDLDIIGIRWFGSEAGRPLPFINDFPASKHTKANSRGIKADRPSKREIPLSRFTRIDDVADLFTRFFATSDS